MTKDEALKLALEALELHGKQYPHMVKGYCLDTITTIKEALAQPDFEKIADDLQNICDKQALKLGRLEALLAQPEQEPVGWAEHGVINWLADRQFNHTSFLYDTPAQRTWVGLTDEDISEIVRGTHNTGSFVRAIEAKLRSKNESKN